MYNSKPLKLSALTAAITLTTQGYVLANEEVDHEQNTIIVVGEATAGLDNIITQEELNKAQATNLSDIFRSNPTVNASDGIALAQKLYVRDIGEAMLNITVDGAEQAASPFHHTGRLNIEPELLKQVEVEAGAGSATVGPGALGGSVKFTTKDAADLLKADQNTGAIVKTTYSSNGELFKNSATVYGQALNEKISGIASIVSSSNDLFVDGNGDNIYGSENEELFGYGKITFQPSIEHKLSFSYENLNGDSSVLKRPEWAYDETVNPSNQYEIERETATLNYNYTSINNELIDTYINIYQTENQLERLDGDAFVGSVESNGVTLQNTSLASINEFIYGINLRADTSKTSDNNEENGFVWGLYIQDIIDVSESLTVTTGLRYDTYSLEDWNDQQFDDAGFSPNLSANYSFTDNFSLSAGYAQALRGVEIADSFVVGLNTNAANLKAETSHNTELGANFSTTNLNIEAGVYYAVIEDVITFYRDSGVSYYGNLDENFTNKGLYISSAYNFGKLSLGADLKISETKVGDEYVSRYVHGSNAVSTGNTLYLNADYEFTKDLSVGWQSTIVQGIDEFITTSAYGEITTEKPGYSTHDIYAYWKPLDRHDLTFDLRVNNLFNEQYLSHSSVEDYTDTYYYLRGNYEPGRDIRITAAYKY
ncbi:TonB-dependent receptor domain-containing protein [Reinekea thalattae]|uniref:TonB-dependent receptor n=1 Tax=Reinekea thalattae TaxID=2593301 RepID=A0A5C8Z990_9GAMM|nr:TonB-dependent receptor [Reinekea thalattae]TXR54277.1 TonB-dependent receptor [Reinekea thalattae]